MALLEAAIEGLKSAADHYVKDLQVMSDEEVLQSVGGSARKPVDFSFEVGLINLRIAARLRGEEPPPTPDGEWWEAPAELRTKVAITEYLKTSCETLAIAASKLSDDEIEKPIGAPGHEQPALMMINFAAMHTMYHDAQLNFIQSLKGDLEVHWS
jgi:hypothetical protein